MVSFSYILGVATIISTSLSPVAALSSTTTSTSKSSTTTSKPSTTISTSSSSSTASTSTKSVNVIASESVGANNVVATNIAAAPQSTTAVTVSNSDGTVQTFNTNTTAATNGSVNAVAATTAVTGTAGTILVIARDSASAYSAFSGLNGYGIPYQVLVVPQGGVALPSLTTSSGVGAFAAIVILSEVSYDYGGTVGYQSALTTDQWSSLFSYQLTYGVRMVRLDVYPSDDTGTAVVSGGCCGDTQEQYISISNAAGFTQAGLKVGATMSTLGLYHYPATITNSSIATAFAQFGTTTGYSKVSTAGVINNIGGREQMIFFISFATDWSQTSNFLQHAWIQWATRGLYAGYRRVNLGTQVDDMFLETGIYGFDDYNFRIRTGDLNAVKAWVPKLNAKLPTGSKYFIEIGHNGNGNIEASDNLDNTGTLCTSNGPIEYDAPDDPPLEYMKTPLGSGTNLWPAKPTAYPYSTSCTNKDTLKTWWATPANRDVFAHVSHTFTHENQNNATFYDIFNEISWNQAWLTQTSLASAAMFSPNGLIPPAITGLHNGDALRAWVVRGIKNAVGDNTRPLLLNTQNEHWPLITTVANNGYDGVQITPRWATNIFYNCDRANCTLAEWIATGGGSGDINNLLLLEKQSAARHLLGLHHDPFMFHQANLRQTDVDKITINGVSAQLSLLQMWVETVAQEMIRIVNWPIISLKHDDIAASFANRMARDQCGYATSYTLDPKAKTITGVTVTATGNSCSAPVPLTVPGKVLSTQGFTTEQVGNDPMTIWVTKFPSTFTLSTPLKWA